MTREKPKLRKTSTEQDLAGIKAELTALRQILEVMEG